MTTQTLSPPVGTFTPFHESSSAAGSSELRSTMCEDGYLYFRGLVPAEEVLAVRGAVLELCAEAGWLDPSADLMDGIANPEIQPLREGDSAYTPVYRKILRTPRFHDFPTNPALLKVAEAILGGEVIAHPRRIGRVTFPNFAACTTPAHQDFYYIRGTPETYTCWAPLGECPQELGGLAILPGSHQRGFVEHSQYNPVATGGHSIPMEENLTWHTGDFGIGDVLFFHSHTIHKALPNNSGDRLRLSTDNRYQRAKDDIDPASLKPHMGLE